MAKKVKKAKRVRKVKMDVVFGYCWVDDDGNSRPATTFAYLPTDCRSRRVIGDIGISPITGEPRPAIVVEDTPANRKRLGVKRGK